MATIVAHADAAVNDRARNGRRRLLHLFRPRHFHSPSMAPPSSFPTGFLGHRPGHPQALPIAPLHPFTTPGFTRLAPRVLAGAPDGAPAAPLYRCDDVDPADDARGRLPVPDVVGGADGRGRPGARVDARTTPRTAPRRAGSSAPGWPVWPAGRASQPGSPVSRGAAVADARDAAGPAHRRPARAAATGASRWCSSTTWAGSARPPQSGGRVRPDLLRPEVRVGGVGAGGRTDPGADPRRAPARAGAVIGVRGGAGVRDPHRARRRGQRGRARGGRGRVRPLGLPRRRPAAAHPRRGPQPGPGRVGRRVADPGLQGPVPGDGRPVRAVQRAARGPAHPRPRLGLGPQAAAPLRRAEVGGRRRPGRTLREEFSQRSTAIETAKDDLVEDVRGLPRPAAHRRRRSSSCGNRPPWRPAGQARQTPAPTSSPGGGTGPHVRRRRPPGGWVAAAGRAARRRRLLTAADLEEGMLRDARPVVADTVADKRATFTRANLLAETHRQLHGVRFATPADRIAVAEHTATLAAGRAVHAHPTRTRPAPEAAASRGRHEHAARPQQRGLHHAEILDAEARLLAAGRPLTGRPSATPSPPGCGRWVAPGTQDRPLRGAGRPRSPRSSPPAAAWTCSSGRRHRQVHHHGRRAGRVGSQPTDPGRWSGSRRPPPRPRSSPTRSACPTENTAKWLAENQHPPQRREVVQDIAEEPGPRVPDPAATAQLQTRKRAPDRQLPALGPTARAAGHHRRSLAWPAPSTWTTSPPTPATSGAKVLLVGDWAQLSPVQAGGAFSCSPTTAAPTPPRWHDVHRFTNEWERDASLQLRARRPRRRRHLPRPRPRSSPATGRTCSTCSSTPGAPTPTRAAPRLMIAADTDTVTDLNTRARAHRVRAGQVSAGRRAARATATTAGVGDLVVTRLNDRALTTGRGWVKNGDDWTVRAVHDDGSLQVTRAGDGRARSAPRRLRVASTSSSATPPPPTAPKAAPSTPHTPTCASAPPANPCTSWPPGDGRPTSSISTPRPNRTRVPPHGPGERLEAIDVLQQAIAASAAELSATETRRREQQLHHARSLSRPLSRMEPGRTGPSRDLF